MIVLRIVAGLYLISGLWCLFQTELAASYVGYTVTGTSGMAEFFTVYGGIQLGLGLALLLGSLKQSYQEASLFFGFVVSATLIAARLISFIVYPEALDYLGAWMMAELEGAIAIVLGVAYFRLAKRQQQLGSPAV